MMRRPVWRDALAAMPDLGHDIQEVVVDGEVEMARVVVTGTMATSFAGVEGSGRSFRIDLPEWTRELASAPLSYPIL